MRVHELRQYTHHPGTRDTLIALFEEIFLDEQLRMGMEVPGTFRDRAAPDRFVWLRGFADLDERTRLLTAFYDGPVWRRNRDAANATLIDSDDVLLLQEAAPGSALRPGASAGGTVWCGVHPRAARGDVEAALAAQGVIVLGRYVTHPGPNGHPRLPVREGEDVFVWLAAMPGGRRPELAAATMQLMELEPTARSRLQ